MDNFRQKAGFVDVKFPPKSRGLKVKPWKRRWVAVHQMSDLAAGQTLARVDIYPDEDSASNPHSEKTTVILENITAVRRTKSRTHPYAFEIVDSEVRLSLSGYSEGDTQGWMILLRHILWPTRTDEAPPADAVEVSIIDNKYSHGLHLSGNYWFSVTPEAVTLLDPVDCEMRQTWRLNSLKSFHLARTQDDRDQDQILVIQAGPLAETGEGEYLFFSPRALEILKQIKRCIQQALALRQGGHRQRTCSTTSSVLNYHSLLERHNSGLADEVHLEEDLQDTEAPPLSRIPKHLAPSRSVSLPRNMSELSAPGDSFCPPEHVIVPHHRRLTEGELPEDDLPNTLLRPCRSAENVPENVGGPISNLISDIVRATPVPKDVENICRDKPRTVSVSSTVSRASGSITSRDSGIMFGNESKIQIEEELNINSGIRDTSNSFDSAVSTSGPADDIKPRVKPVGDHPTEDNCGELLIQVSDCLNNVQNQDKDDCRQDPPEQTGEERVKKQSVVSNIYADIGSRKTSTVSNEYAAIDPDIGDNISASSGGKLVRSHSADRLMGENDYEELDSFRKDLKKHLGFNPGVNSTDEPPALPERPSSTNVIRRHKTPGQMSRKDRASKVASMFVKSTRKFSSSSSEDDDVNILISQVRNWPLKPQTSVTDDNSLYHSSSEQVLYDEITKSYERLDNIVRVEVSVTDQLVPAPLFDMISPPPLSCQLASNWGNVDLLTSSPVRLSPVSPLSPLTPNKNVFDSSWTTVSGSPISTSLLVDISDRQERRRSSTLSCPCQDERCSHTVSDDGESSRGSSRSFSEVSERLSVNWNTIPNPTSEPNDTYECMSGSPPAGQSSRSPCKFSENWADFSSFGGEPREHQASKDSWADMFTRHPTVEAKDQQFENKWADFSVFGDLELSGESKGPSRDTHVAKQILPDKNNEIANKAEVINLIEWDIVENPSADADNTYMDMSLPK